VRTDKPRTARIVRGASADACLRATIAAVEDKIVQRATVPVLNVIYEEEFFGFSYGFRPERSQHDALARISHTGF
jgi:retron-type reverse transcriptase